ncbi:MAG: hypothetical protein FWF76_04235 [Oscillospiraceae bacterium]|nr:hypothetical protein [Oscillospiraceae bacterium]
MNNRSKISFNIAYCGIISALAILVMFVSVVPSLTYMMPAFAGVIVWSVYAQIHSDKAFRWAVMTYLATSLLSLILVPEIQARTFFILFFGYYPLLREKLVGVKFWAVRFIFKLLLFNVTAVISYFIAVELFGVADTLEGLEWFGDYAIYAFWGLGNLAFLCYDFALTYVFYAFRHWFKPIMDKKLK